MAWSEELHALVLAGGITAIVGLSTVVFFQSRQLRSERQRHGVDVEQTIVNDEIIDEDEDLVWVPPDEGGGIDEDINQQNGEQAEGQIEAEQGFPPAEQDARADGLPEELHQIPSIAYISAAPGMSVQFAVPTDIADDKIRNFLEDPEHQTRHQEILRIGLDSEEVLRFYYAALEAIRKFTIGVTHFNERCIQLGHFLKVCSEASIDQTLGTESIDTKEGGEDLDPKLEELVESWKWATRDILTLKKVHKPLFWLLGGAFKKCLDGCAKLEEGEWPNRPDLLELSHPTKDDEKSPVEDMKTFSVNLDGPTTGNRPNHRAYEFNGKQLVVIINNFTKSRAGTEKDEENLRTFFNQFMTQRSNGVMSTIRSYPDLSKEEMENSLVNIALELKREIYDRLLVFILSHGKEDAVIGYHIEFDQENHNVNRNCYECENPMKIEKIYEIFADSIPRKPKLVFLVACNGHQPLEQADHQSDMDDYSDSPPIMAPCPKRADMLIGCASVKGYISFRRSDIGTYYIDNLLEVFKSDMSDSHLVDMITEAQRRVSQRISTYVEKGTRRTGFVQMPYYQSSLRGPVYLLPRPSYEN